MNNKTEQSARANSPGCRYVTDYLVQERGGDCDTRWIADCINDGRLVACPRCHFLHLPAVPFPPSRKAQEMAPPVDACDVCAAVPAMCDPINWGADWEQALPHSGHGLADERTMRAITLYRLWIGATDGADALRVAAIFQRLEDLRALVRTPGASPDVAEGGQSRD